MSPNGPQHDAEVVEEELALIIYTSDTTGKPKGALLDHRSIEAMAWTADGHGLIAVITTIVGMR
ncbi:AMP-binding protein [Nocardia sp. CA-128927]|uniref:AMP-binding protein n=1 Tax=Nocardia sp. CA-128927 TaxID=3239975 RepID=UPI003D956407